MKFFFGIFLAVLVAMTAAEELKSTDEVKVETTTETVDTLTRNKRDFILSTYAAPVAALPVAAPAYITPYSYTYSASYTPYAYTAYHAYAPYYSYPAYV